MILWLVEAMRAVDGVYFVAVAVVPLVVVIVGVPWILLTHKKAKPPVR